MKKKFSIILSIFITTTLFSQISYDHNDLFNPGDTIRTSTALTTGSIDFKLTGNNYNWNLSSLFPVSQNLDTFISIISTPSVYQFVFNNIIFYPNNVATIALKQEDIETMPTFKITDINSFYKESSSKYEFVGFGGSLNGIPIPVPNDNNDIIYKFPVSTTSSSDSCISSYSVLVPNFGYLGQTKKRVNIVDGWGTLSTPFGTFNVIRIKSLIHQKDTFHLDSLGFPIPAIVRDYIEYKWLAKNYGIPILQINADLLGIPTEIIYIDSIRSILGTNEIINQKFEVQIFPNPANTYFNLSFKNSNNENINLEIYDATGKLIRQEKYNSPKIIKVETDDFSKGLYFVRIIQNSKVFVKKIVIQ